MSVRPLVHYDPGVFRISVETCRLGLRMHVVFVVDCVAAAVASDFSPSAEHTGTFADDEV
jgi:hypothetical protein